MKKITGLVAISLVSITLVGCSGNQPMTEAEQAESYNMTLEEYRETKQAAARMNMTIEEHMKMIEEEGEDHMGGDMDM